MEAVRQSGFTGRLVLATREKHLPYDRPKLSKALDMSAEKLRLRSPEFYKVGSWTVVEVLCAAITKNVLMQRKTSSCGG